MKIIKSQLESLIKVNNLESITLEKIAEVASYLPVIDTRINNLVVGKVLTCVDHPNSDHLHITTVNVGEKELQIVCGAPNVRAGQTVIVALEGAQLAPDFIIKPVKLRGVESNGMICALDEIGLASFGNKDEKGIFVFDKAVKPGTDAYQALGLNDMILDLDLTNNRGDLFSYYGLALDLSAATSKKITIPHFKVKTDKIQNPYTLTVTSDKCLFYEGRYFTDLEIKPSPQWLKNFLIIHDIKPQNNIVDITNYILIKYGCPLHAFDCNKLTSSNIIVKQATSSKVVTLTNQEIDINEKVCVISDDQQSIALAGVIGLDNSKISKDTTSVFLESAIFDRNYIANITNLLKINTDASDYYKRGVSQEVLEIAINECCYLFQTLAGATLSSKVVRYKAKYSQTKKIKLTVAKVNKVLGTNLQAKDIIKVFSNLGFSVIENEKYLLVNVPERRFDCNIAEDLIEEFGRLYGYNNLKGEVKPLILPQVENKELIFTNKIRSLLTSLGLNETISYSLIAQKDAGNFADSHKLYTLPVGLKSGMDSMRPSIIPSLIKIDEYNKNRFQEGSSIFEISNVYTKDSSHLSLAVLLSKPLTNISFLNPSPRKISFFTIKGILDYLFEKLQLTYDLAVSSYKIFHPYLQANIKVNNQILGFIGQYNNLESENPIVFFELDLLTLLKLQETKDPVFRPFSKYPSMVRDISFAVNKDTPFLKICNFIQSNLPDYLESVDLFDCFMLPDDNTSYSISLKLKFTDYTGKLTNDEVIKLIDSLKEKLVKEFSVVNR